MKDKLYYTRNDQVRIIKAVNDIISPQTTSSTQTMGYDEKIVMGSCLPKSEPQILLVSIDFRNETYLLGHPNPLLPLGSRYQHLPRLALLSFQILRQRLSERTFVAHKSLLWLRNKEHLAACQRDTKGGTWIWWLFVA